MKFFVFLSNGTYCSYFGMPQARLEEMLTNQGLTWTYMTEEDFNLAVQALLAE